MEKIRNLSIRRSFALYLSVAMILSFFCAVLVQGAAEQFQIHLYRKHLKEETYYEALEEVIYEENLVYWGNSHGVELSDVENFLSETCDFLITWSGLLIPMIGCGGAILLFYRKKIQPPLDAMSQALEAIAREEWEHSIDYQNRDELGQLCEKFEQMRLQLKDNNRKLWGMIEEEKALRSAIAHDIRSPLAVLRGYQEMLLEFVPQERLDKDKVMEILRTGLDQIERMNRFVDTMKELSRLEERTVVCEKISVRELAQTMEETGNLLAAEAGKQCLAAYKGKSEIQADRELILEVYENLLTNAVRYAKKEVAVTLEAGEKFLVLTVKDDGEGFREDAETVTKAYYHSNPLDDLKHFGLGLYMSRMYCEKHGGRLLISNCPGGCVQAEFREGIEEQNR